MESRNRKSEDGFVVDQVRVVYLGAPTPTQLAYLANTYLVRSCVELQPYAIMHYLNDIIDLKPTP